MKLKHNLFSIAALFFFYSFVNYHPASAIQPVARENTVIFDIDSDMVASPFNFNWMVPGASRNQGMHQAVWEPLFILNYETSEIESWLGESFTSNSTADVWTLKIRSGVRWADNEPFDASDVAFTIRMLLEDKTQSLNEAANMQQWVQTVEKIDDLSVQFHLKASNPRFQLDYFSVRVWGSVVILPEHIWAGKDPFTFDFFALQKGWPLGTGPYRLISASEQEFIYDRRDDWWGLDAGFQDLPVPERLIWVVTGMEESRSLLIADRQLDSVMDITLGAFEAIQAMNPNAIAWKDRMPYIWLDPCPRQLSVNHTVKPWDDPGIRRALSLIIDRQQVVKIAYEGTSLPSRTIFVEYKAMEPYIQSIKELWLNPVHNLVAGRGLIKARGWKLNSSGLFEKDGKLLSLDIQIYEGGVETRRVAEVVVEQLRGAGIDATTRGLAGSTFSDNLAHGHFEAVIDSGACGSVNEPWVSMNRYTTQFYRLIGERSPGHNNSVRWSGEVAEQYSQLVEKIGTMSLGNAAVEPLFVKAMELFMADQVIIPITQGRKLVPFDTTYWVGWPTAKDNYIQPTTWWMNTHRIIHNLRQAN